MAPSATSSSATADIMRIMVATDNHLGYLEKDPVRGGDSFDAFEEILQHATKARVDFLLLGGDLFHDNKPSRRTIFRTMKLLRRYCMGSRPVQFRLLSDPQRNFGVDFSHANYEDPNYNVGLPVFSIHGNHDDPTRDGGVEALAACDLLSVSNLVNYFGKNEKVDDIEISPVLLQKGQTRIALYGLGSIRDERLNRMFSQKKVRFIRPAEARDDWFNIFVVHQNRDNRGRGSKNCIHESFIPEFIDFVVWGHEHECLINPEESLKGRCYISQPGSSVATSLVEGEAAPKHIGLLEIRFQEFRLTPVPLKSIRPFAIEEVDLADLELDPNDPQISTRIANVLTVKVNEMIDSTKPALEQEETKKYKEVLVRLKVEHTGFPILNNQRFGAQFVGKVANPNDILLFFRRRATRVPSKQKPAGKGSSILSQAEHSSQLEGTKVEDIVAEKLERSEKRLSLLPEMALHHALEDYIKGNTGAIGECVDQQLDDTQRLLEKEKTVEDTSAILNVVEQQTARKVAEAELEKEKTVTKEPPRKKHQVNGRSTPKFDSDASDATEESSGVKRTRNRERVTKKVRQAKADEIESGDDHSFDELSDLEPDRRAARKGVSQQRGATKRQVETPPPSSRKRPRRAAATHVSYADKNSDHSGEDDIDMGYSGSDNEEFSQLGGSDSDDDVSQLLSVKDSRSQPTKGRRRQLPSSMAGKTHSDRPTKNRCTPTHGRKPPGSTAKKSSRMGPIDRAFGRSHRKQINVEEISDADYESEQGSSAASQMMKSWGRSRVSQR